MEIAVISDVHSNLPALEVVLDDIGDLEVFCCGDVIGYNPFPNETLEILRKRKVKSVLGNHDYAVVKEDITWLNINAAIAALWTLDVITKDNLGYLASLPETFKGEGFAAVHGSPKDPLFEYVYPEYHLELLESFLGDSGVLILGHTHIPFVKHLKGGVVFNPGSVGQPRDGDPRAAYAVLDPEKKEVRLKRLSYDINRTAEEIIKKGLPEELGERLYFGL
ncbi:MAG: metallophosphoesterase family protein [Candidatus Hydrothermarchaeales archaeon]